MCECMIRESRNTRTTTIVTGGCPGRSLNNKSPFASCWNETSPITKVTGNCVPAAKPAAADTTPSIPDAPRFAQTGAPGPKFTLVVVCRDPFKNWPPGRTPARASTSLIGMEFPRKRPMLGGNAFATNKAAPISVMPSADW